MAVKINYWMSAGVTVFLAITVIAILMITMVWFDSHFDKILTLTGTVLGSITGFYFGGRSRKP